MLRILDRLTDTPAMVVDASWQRPATHRLLRAPGSEAAARLDLVATLGLQQFA